MFIDQQLSEEARLRAEAAAAAANAKQHVKNVVVPAIASDSELVPNRPDLDVALEAAREQRAQEEEAKVMETLNPHKPKLMGWRRTWAVTKLCLAALTIFPIRLSIMIVAFMLMSIVATAVVLIGCLSCRCATSSSLSVKPKTWLQRAVLRLVSPLARLVLFALGFIYIREHRVENDCRTARLRRRCWQCRPSRKAQAGAAGAAAIATAVASRSGSKFRPGASTSAPQRLDAEVHAATKRQRIDAVAAAHGSTIIANHSSVADVLYIAWRYPATSVASDFFKLIPCFWVIANAIGVLFLTGHRADGTRTGGGASHLIMQYQHAAASEQGHHLRRLLVFPEGTTTNGRQLLQFRTGAFVAGLPVQPVLITYRWQFRNPHFTSSMLSTVLELMTSWYNMMEVKELPVHYPTTKEQADARVFADNMQALMASGLGIPKVPISNKQVLHAWKRHTARQKARVEKQPKRTQVAPATASSRGAQDELGALVHSSTG